MNKTQFRVNPAFVKLSKDNSIKTVAACVCCLSQKGQFIELVQCKHLWLFGTIKNFQINNNFRRVCVMCHHLLVKFSQLRQQIVENMILLEKQVLTLKNSERKVYFKRTHVEHIDIAGVTKESGKVHKQSIDEGSEETDTASEFGSDDLTEDPFNLVPKLPKIEAPLLTSPTKERKGKEHNKIMKLQENKQILHASQNEAALNYEMFKCSTTNSVTVDPNTALDSMSIFESDFENKFKELNNLLDKGCDEVMGDENTIDGSLIIENVTQTGTNVKVKEEFSLNDIEISLKTEPDDVCYDIETSIEVNVIPTNMETEAGSANVENESLFSKTDTIPLEQRNVEETQSHTNINSFNANEVNVSKIKIVSVDTLAKEPVHSGSNKRLNIAQAIQNLIKSTENEKLDPRELGTHYRRYACQHCDVRCKTLTDAIKHLSEVHYQDSWVDINQCRHCDFVSKCARNLHRHEQKEHKEWTHKCDQCYKVYPDSYSLKMHIKRSHEEKRYECKTCHKFFAFRGDLKCHEKKKHTPRSPTTAATPAHCAKCNKTYKTDKLLQIHIKKSVHHDENIRYTHRLTCDHCGRAFVDKDSLRAHILGQHFPAWRPKCPICSKVFSRDSVVRKHIQLVHNNKKPPKNKICSHCGKGFRSSSELRVHLRTHTGERPLLCAHCGATFAHPGALYTHIRLKHKGRPYTDTNTEANK